MCVLHYEFRGERHILLYYEFRCRCFSESSDVFESFEEFDSMKTKQYLWPAYKVNE